MERIAILTGGGGLPLMLADSIERRGGRAHLVAVRGEAGPEVESYPHTWVTWGSINAILAALKRESDGTMMIAGSVRRPDLRQLKPDFGLIRYLPSVLQMLKGGDDAVLTRLIRFFEGHGLTVKGVSDVAPELLAEAGTFGAPTGSATIEADTALGFRVLETLADLDVGQAIAVEGGRILAIEGVEGTDRMLARIGLLDERPSRGGVLVKGPKRGQDLRVDVPTVGARTIEALKGASLSTLVIVAGKTLLLERASTIETAASSGIAIRSLAPVPNAAAAVEAPQRLAGSLHGTMLGRLSPNAANIADARTAMEVILRLQAFDTGRAAAVVRDHVLAVAAAEGPVQMAARVAELRQWGRKRTKRGAVAVMFDADHDEAHELVALIEALSGANLAGVAVIRAATAIPMMALPSEAVAAADRLGLFLFEVSGAVPSTQARPKALVHD